jgi:hypothetical protein
MHEVKHESLHTRSVPQSLSQLLAHCAWQSEKQTGTDFTFGWREITSTGAEGFVALGKTGMDGVGL